MRAVPAALEGLGYGVLARPVSDEEDVHDRKNSVFLYIFIEFSY